MARKRKRPELTRCKVQEVANPRAPWRVWYDAERDGQPVRLRKQFASEDAAWQFAEERENEIRNHGIRYGDIPPEARRAFDFYRDTAAELAELGASVPTFAELVTDALAAIRTRHHEQTSKAITIAEAVALFIAHKQTRVGSGQAGNLKIHLGRFARDFGTRPMPSITMHDIEAWLSSLRSRRNPEKLPVAPLIDPNTRNAYRTSLVSFFKHGANPLRAWCTVNPAAAIEAESINESEPQAYTPQDAKKIMQAALNLQSPLLPSLALEMFAGVRPSEAMVIDLSAVDLGDKEFRVPGTKPSGEKTKTGARIVPLLPSAKAWLAAQTRRDGFAYTGTKKERSKEMRRILAAAGVEGIHDGPRHSFITYRTAETRDVARVADECGNSPNVIAKHYRQIVNEASATVFFAIRPEAKAANVTHIQEGRATA